jgi:hypothetical protein
LISTRLGEVSACEYTFAIREISIVSSLFIIYTFNIIIIIFNIIMESNKRHSRGGTRLVKNKSNN